MKSLIYLFLAGALALASCSKDDPEPVAVGSVTLDKTEVILNPGESETLTATVLPENADDKSVTWRSSAPTIATVSDAGLVTAVSPGTATITATAAGKSASCAVTVESVAVESISLDKTELILNPGGSETLTATVVPDNATDKTVAWSSDTPDVATVDESGIVTGVKPGAATITATASGKSATCAVTVEPVAVGGITLDKTTLALNYGASKTLTATVLPDNATVKTVKWSSNTPDVATVDDNGKVSAVNLGYALITATAGERSAICVIRVIPAEGVLINGLVWAKTNVDTPDTFAANPEDVGMFYQWNIKTAWSTTDPLTSLPAGQKWSHIDPTGPDRWEAAKDPCPEGWRVPIEEELRKLVEVGKVSSEWTTLNGVNGREFKDNSSGDTVFFPAFGYRSSSMKLEGLGEVGNYWTSTYFYDQGKYTLSYYRLNVNSTTAEIQGLFHSNGISIRCVLE